MQPAHNVLESILRVHVIAEACMGHAEKCKNVDSCFDCRRMRLKRNYKFQMYEDSVKGQAPAAGQAADAHLRAHLPLPGQPFLAEQSA